ncbi:MAG: 4'-phosphopantetheinyl transferase superfamily protein [Bacteroidota bacterium]
MISIYYYHWTEPFPNQKWKSYYQQVPPDIQARIQRYRKVENKYQLLMGRLLLKKGMHELGFVDFRLSDVYYDEFNCPKWSDSVYFNIAHSGNVVACAFSTTQPIGLDIEQIRPINLADFDYVLNEVDQQAITKASDPYLAFFKIWTIKEAVTKAMGQGLAIDVQPIYIFEKYALHGDRKWYYQTLDLGEDFAGHLVTDRPNFEARLLKQSF